MSAEPNTPSFVCSLLGSATAGLISRTICHPMDTIKAKLQSAEGFILKGFTDTIVKTIREEGVGGLYRGLGAVVVGGVPGVCVYLTTYDACKDRLIQVKTIEKYPFITYFTSGIIAEAVCCILFVPVDVVKERLQTQSLQNHAKYKGSLDAITTIIREEGFKGIYKGYNATLLSYGPFSALYFYFYEMSKSYVQLKKKDKNYKDLNFNENLICSALAGSSASFITNPLDLAKLRFQVQRNNNNNNLSNHEYRYKGLFDAMSHEYKLRGLRGLFRGSLARILFHTPSTAITMALYEECKKIWMTIIIR